MRAVLASIYTYEISAIADASTFSVGEGEILLTEDKWGAEPQPGQIWQGNVPATFVVPVVQVPQEITRRQARLALLMAGKLNAVNTAISSIPDPMVRAVAQIEWDEALTINRNSPLIAQMAPALGLTSKDIDNLFVQGAKL